MVGKTVSITAVVNNIGGSEGTYAAMLTIDGVLVEAKEVAITPGGSKVVTFSLAKDTPGTYEIDIGGLKSTLMVKEEGQLPPSSEVYESLQYFKITEGFGIKYHVTDDYQPLDCNVWAISQYFETGKPHELDFVFTLTKEGTTGEYFRNSCISGKASRVTGGKELTGFNHGYPVGNQANFYFNFSLPRFFDSGDWWSWADKEYSVEHVGVQTINGIKFNDCIRVNVDGSQNVKHEYLKGTGYFILARDIGIVELVFDRTDGTRVMYEYVSHDQLTKHRISGSITHSDALVQGIIVQIASANWGTRSVTDLNGAFSIQAYGPDVVLNIGYDKDNDDVFEFDDPNYPIGYCVNNITSDTSGLNVEIGPAP